MIRNEFKADAQELISISAPYIKDEMTRQDVILATTFFAFGVERLLQHILWMINPVFVLKNGDFKNAAPCLYKRHFVNTDQHGETSSKPDSDVISMRVAMQRSVIFSRAVKDNGQLLFTLANYRDILAHKSLSELDVGKARLLMTRDGVRLIDNICIESGLNLRDFLAKTHLD